jgi:hypothetical protein
VGRVLTGACPAPLFALIGNGVTVMLQRTGRNVVYGAGRPHVPH